MYLFYAKNTHDKICTYYFVTPPHDSTIHISHMSTWKFLSMYNVHDKTKIQSPMSLLSTKVVDTNAKWLKFDIKFGNRLYSKEKTRARPLFF